MSGLMPSVLLSPALVLGVLVSIGYASLYHLWGGRSVRDLLLYLVAAGFGFIIGQTIGLMLNVDLLQIGQINMLEASIGAWAALIIVGLLDL